MVYQKRVKKDPLTMSEWGIYNALWQEVFLAISQQLSWDFLSSNQCGARRPHHDSTCGAFQSCSLAPSCNMWGWLCYHQKLILPGFSNFHAYSPQLLYLYAFFNHYHQRSMVLSCSARWPYKGSQIQPNCRISWYAFLVKNMCRDVQTDCVQKLFLVGYVQKWSILG